MLQVVTTLTTLALILELLLVERCAFESFVDTLLEIISRVNQSGDRVLRHTVHSCILSCLFLSFLCLHPLGEASDLWGPEIVCLLILVSMAARARHAHTRVRVRVCMCAHGCVRESCWLVSPRSSSRRLYSSVPAGLSVPH